MARLASKRLAQSTMEESKIGSDTENTNIDKSGSRSEDNASAESNVAKNMNNDTTARNGMEVNKLSNTPVLDPVTKTSLTKTDDPKSKPRKLPPSRLKPDVNDPNAPDND